MIKQLRIFVFDYWHYLLFGIFALVVILGVMYFNRQQYQERRKRLNHVSLNRVTLSEDFEETSKPDKPSNGVLLPMMHVYLPLPADWPLREDWGEPITVQERRIPGMVLREAPAMRGPNQ